MAVRVAGEWLKGIESHAADAADVDDASDAAL